MVKLAGPLFSIEAQGTIGGAITYQKGFGKHRAMRVPTHRDAESAGQLTQRSLFLDAVAAWNALSAPEKAAYNTRAKFLQMTGYNLFVKEYIANPPVPVMEQVIFGGSIYNTSGTGVQYNYLGGGNQCGGGLTARLQVVSTPGLLRSLYVELNGAPGEGTSYTFAVMKNGVAQSLSVTISNLDTTGSDVDAGHEVSLAVGDTIQLRITPSGTPTARRPRWAVVYEGTIACESLILGCGQTEADEAVWYPLSCASGQSCSNESYIQQIIPTSGVIRNLYVVLDVDPGVAPDAYRFTLRKNGVSTALTCTITANDVAGHDTDLAHAVTVVEGDYVSLMCEPLEGPAVEPLVFYGLTFVAAINGESLILGGSYPQPSVAVANYNGLISTVIDRDWSSVESGMTQGAHVTTLKKLSVRLLTAPGAGKSYTFKPRVSAADSGIAVTISESDVAGNDSVNSKVLAAFDDLAMSCIPAGTPAATRAFWGLVGYIAP